ncbi:MAG: response regulator [Candidatus Paracaedibacter sp.]
MKYLKKYLICVGILLTFSFSVLAAESSNEEGQEGTPKSYALNKGSLIPKTSSIPNTWGVSEKEMEEAFQENEHLVCLMVFGEYFTRLNDRWKEVLGWELEELLNTPYYDFIHPDDMEKTLNYESHFIPTGFTNRYRAKDGSYRWFSWIGLSNLKQEAGVSSFAIILDITLDEILKKEGQTQIRILNEHTNLQTRVIKSLVDLQKLYLGEIGRYSDNKSEPFSLHYMLHHFLKLSESDFGFMAEVISEGGGKKLDLKTWEANTSLMGGSKELFDIFKQGEEIPPPFKGLLDAVLDQGQSIALNDVQSYLKNTESSGHFPSFKSFLGIPLRSTNGPVGILALVNRDYGYNPLLLEWFEPLLLLAGRIVNEVKLLRFQKYAKNQSIEKEKAQAKNEAKSAFLAHMSHELRTPLSGLVGTLDLIKQEQMTPEDLLYLQMAKDTSASLLYILNDILDLSKIEENKLVLEEIEFNPLKIAKEVVKLLAFSAKKKNVSLKLISDADIPNKLIGDPSRIRQILMNLVGNAIKFTEKGSVKVSLNGEPEGKESPYILSATIKDTGIGISPDNLDNLFQPFSQAEESMSRRFGGTGLGLYITKCLCEIMGGKIDAKSVEGEGSKFHFKIKLLLPGKLAMPKLKTSFQASDVLPPLHIMVVEDNPVIQLVTKAMLERSGCSVTAVNNGLEALKAIKKEGIHYDLILMDGQMPEMDGFEATRQIRKSYGLYELPVIGLTAHAMLTDKNRFLESGMNGYLTKPVNKKDLTIEILRCLHDMAEHRTNIRQDRDAALV